MNPFEFILAIIIIATIGKVMQARYGHSRGRDESDDRDSRRSRRGRTLLSDPEDGAETQRLKEEVRSLKDRLQVLERITVEKESSLNREIDSLRDR